MLYRAIGILIFLTLGVALCGCGGGGNDATTRTAGTVKMSVIWPDLPLDDDRFIPRATHSLVVTIDNGAGITESQTLPRPDEGVNSVVIFPEVPTGTYLIRVVAYPTTNGTGTPLALAETTAVVNNREATTVTLDLTSTITEVTIDQYPTDINATETAQLLATARDDDGDLVAVLPQPDGFLWSTSDPAIATVNQLGVLTAVAAGQVTVSAMERETGVTGTIDLLINPATGTLEIIVLNGGINVIVTPSTANLTTTASMQFAAQVIGVPNQAVIWSVQEPNGGTITADGLYTAPDMAGTYHVVAASVADETKTATATINVRQGRIAYCLYDVATDNYDIYTICADGANQTRLTTHAAIDAYPALSFDGLHVTFASLRDGKYAIYTMNADGTGLTRVTDPAYHSYQPTWSPDSSKIVFLSERDNSHDLYMIDADGSNMVRLTNTAAFEYAPAFSADGTRIIFTSDRDGDKDIYSMNLDGSNLQNLTNSTANDQLPCCSPDGQHIVFESDRGGNSDIYMMNFDGSNLVQLTNDAYTDTEPTFSADGSQICFSSTRVTAPEIEELFLMNVDGSNITQLTATPDGFSIMPSWWM